MSGSRRRRRTGSTSRRYKAAELVPIKTRRPGSVGTAEIAACVGVSVVVGLLIALIWAVTARGVTEQIADIRDRAEHRVAAQAATLAEAIRHEMLLVDQSLFVLRQAWNQDPDGFKLAAWQHAMPALTDVASDIFVADDTWTVQQSILPLAVGQKVGGAYVNFSAGALEVFSGDGAKPQEGRLIVGDSGQSVEARRYLMYIVQPLNKPANWKVGASYRSDGLTRLFAQAALGINGVTALLDMQRGVVQAIAGPSARKPVSEIGDSEMFKFLQSKGDSGTWTGATAMDDVVRIHGFSKVAGREMAILVGVTEVEALAPATALASSAHAVAVAATGVVLGIGGIVLWEVFTLRANHRRQRRSVRGQAELESIQAEMAAMRGRGLLHAAQVQALLHGAEDGIALLDPDLRLIVWNQRFASGCGVAAGMLRDGLPIDELMREQARDGRFGALGEGGEDDIEIEVARRVAALRTEPAGAVLPQFTPDGAEVGLHVEVVPDGGGLVLVLAGLRAWQPAAMPETQPAGRPASAVPVYVTVEW